MYTSKETKEVTNLLIGYAPKKVSESMILSCMGSVLEQMASLGRHRQPKYNDRILYSF